MKDYGSSTKAFPDITTGQLFSFWQNCIEGFESANTIFLPKSDRFYRVAQFIDEITPLYKDKKHLIQLNIQSLNTEPRFFKEKIDSIRSSDDVDYVFFVMDGEWVLENNPLLFEQMRLLAYKPEPKDTFIINYETDPYTTDFENISLTNQILCKNIYRVPLYNREDIQHFISYFSKLLDVNLSASDIKLLVNTCGGYVGLVSEIIRNLKLSGKLNYDYKTIKLKLRSIWISFQPEYQTILTAVANNSSYSAEFNSIADSLLEHKLISVNQGKVQLTVPLLKDYILQTTKNIISFTSDNRLKVNGVFLENFTKRETQVISYLINSKKIVNREQISKIIWPDDDDYNEWTLDQLIKRLRDKLKKSGLNPQSLKTIKSKGYIWEE